MAMADILLNLVEQVLLGADDDEIDALRLVEIVHKRGADL